MSISQLFQFLRNSLVIAILSACQSGELSIIHTIYKLPTQPQIIQNQPCPLNMIEIQIDHCTNLKISCKIYLDHPQAIARRCKIFNPPICRSTKSLHFCIDQYEYPYEGLPKTNVSWKQAKELCKNQGKFLCSEDQWTAACQGPDFNPYPYGLERTNDCHIDSPKLLNHSQLIDQRQDAQNNPNCISYYKVQNMTGNVDEWTENNNYQKPYRSVLKGGWWGPLRNNCVAATVGHDEDYRQIQIGFRCCANIIFEESIDYPILSCEN